MSLYAKYLEVPEGAQEDMNINNLSYLISQVSDFTKLSVDGAEDIPYATLEPGIWKLDGKMELLSGDKEYGEKECFLWGYSGFQFDADFSEPISATGLSFRFSPSTDQWPESVRITWYLNRTALQTKTYYPTSPFLTVDNYVSEFDSLTIAATPRSSGELIKIQKFTIGRELIYDKGSLFDVNLLAEVDPSLCSLPADTLSFTVITRDGAVLNPQEDQRVEIYKDDCLECVQFVKDFERLGTNRYRLVCQSRIGTMDEKFYGKIYTPKGPVNSGELGGNVWTKAKTLCETLAHEANTIAEFDTDQDHGPPVEDTMIAGYLPICTQKEALRQVCLASGMVVTTRDGNLKFTELQNKVSYSFRDRDIMQGAKVKKLQPISQIVVTSVQENKRQEDWVILDGYYSPDDIVYEFDGFTQLAGEPSYYWSENYNDFVKIPGVQFDGEYGAGWFRLGSKGTGSKVKVTANNVIEFNKKTHTRVISSAGKKETVLKVDGCTLLFEGWHQFDWDTDTAVEILYTENVTPVMDRLAAYAELRTIVEQEVIVTTQRAGDYVRTVTPWGTTVEGYIISMDSTLTQNGHTARIKILGKEVS